MAAKIKIELKKFRIWQDEELEMIFIERISGNNRGEAMDVSCDLVEALIDMLFDENI